MMRALPFVALVLATPAAAAERTLAFGSFDRVRVQGALDVMITAGSPGGRVTGDADAIRDLDVLLDGTTLIVRPPSGRWQGTAAPTEPIKVSLSTPALTSAVVIGGARVSIERMKGERVDLSVSGTGGVTVGAIDADHAVATTIGSGTLTLAGKAGDARLLSNGTGTIDAAGLDAGNLIVRVEGPGEVRGLARYGAQVNNLGLGRVSVAGSAKCQVTAVAGGPVTCGAASR